MTLISRITGLIRDIALALILGAGAPADAFFVAFRVPNFFRRIFGEGAFSQAFVPVYSEYHARGVNDDHQAFIDHVTGALGGALATITVLGVLGAPALVAVLAPGFLGDPEKYNLTVQILRITFPYLAFVSLVALAAGVLNTHGRFAVPAFTPVLLNVCLIAAALWLAPAMSNAGLALAWGVFIAGAVQLLFQIPFLIRARALPHPRLGRSHPGVTRVLKLMLPAVFGSSVAQVNMLVNTLLASYLVTGSVSWLWYSDRLMEFPLGVFGIALATVILPSLSRRHVHGDPKAFSNLLDWALRWVFLVGVPATIGLIMLAKPILATLFLYGRKFSPHDLEMTARALIAFAIGLPGFILVRILASGFYARQNTGTPARIAALSLLANIVLSLALIAPLAHAGLALAISLAAFVNAGLLYRLLRRSEIYHPLSGWGMHLLRIAIASVVMALVINWGAGDLSGWLAAGAFTRAGRLGVWIALGALVYIATILILGVRPKALVLARTTHPGEDG
jgi:putative peptidoglycan lipid II flippase